MLTKFMRMLFPLEFRLDSLAGCGALLDLHFPLSDGVMIYLPERIEQFESESLALDYYLVTAAHLAGRHEFGTFNLRLCDVPGHERRTEAGREALEALAATFSDPPL